MDVNNAEIARYVVQMQNGDGNAFEKLYNATNQSGYFTALKILKDEDEAQDVLQDSYVKVLEKINEIKSPESFISWFHQIVANTAKNYLAKKKPSLFESDEEYQRYVDLTPDEDEMWQPEKNVEVDELRRQVMEVIDGLKDEKRICILLYYYNELSVADIAKSMGVTENTVKARLFQARKDLRKGFEKLGLKNAAICGVAPISLVLWALRMASKSDGAKFAAGPAAAAVMEGATSAVSSGVAATGTAVAGTAAATGAAQSVAVAGGSIAAKLAAMTVAQKVIVGAVAVGIVAGAATGTAAVVNHVKAEREWEATTQVMEAIVDITADDITDSLFTIEDEKELLTEQESVQLEPIEEPSATTPANSTTGREKVTGTDDNASALTTSVAASETKTTSISTTTTKPTTTEPPTTKSTTTTKPTTTSPSTTTAKPTTTTTRPTTTARSTTAASTAATTTTEPTTTEKVKGTATVNVSYSVTDYADSGSVSFTVQEGDAITTEMVQNAVRSHLSGKYTIDEIVLRSGDTVGSAEAKSYNYTVIVYTD